MENFFNYLNVAIAVSFIYMIVSLLISEIQENLTSLLELRAVSLRSSVINLLEGKDKHDNPDKSEIMQALYDTSLLKSLNQGKKESKGPSYIPKELFSAALLEVLKTRYQLDFDSQDNINDIANKIDNKIQEYQGQTVAQTDQNLPDPTTTNTTIQSLPNQTSDTPISEGVTEEVGVSAWNDPSLDQSIVPLDMVVTPSNIPSNIQGTENITSSPEGEPGNTLVGINSSPNQNPNQPNQPNQNDLAAKNTNVGGNNREPHSDIYLLTNLSTLARRIQNKVNSEEVKLVEFQHGMADWFDQSMIRASGTYKRNAKGISFLLGLIVAILGNVDTISMVDRLYKNQSLTGTINQLANEVVANNSQSIANLNAANTRQEKDAAIQPIKENINVVVDQIAVFPIGWNFPRDMNISWVGWIYRLVGWFISALAFSMGAPFWFELLNKFINVRNAGQRPKGGDTDTPTSPI